MRDFFKIKSCLSLLLCICLFLTQSCSKPQSDNKDTLILQLGGEPSILNPILSTDLPSSQVEDLIYSGLFRVNADLQLETDLLERYTVEPDGKTYVFFLKKNVTWHDGVAFTAEDVKFTFEKILDPKTRTVRRGDFIIAGKPIDFEIIDTHTLKITLPKPYAPFLSRISMGIIPKHIYEKEDINTSPHNRHPIGTGPFTFGEWKSGQHLLLKRNNAYFGDKAKASRILLKIIPDNNTATIALENGEIDESSILGKDYAHYKNHARFDIYRYYGLSYVYLGFNLKHPFFKDVRVRQAISHAIDKEALVKGVLNGFGMQAHIPSVPALWSYPKAGQFSTYPFSTQKSIALLKEAGFVLNPKTGVLEKDGKPFEFTLMTNKGNKDREKSAEVIQQMLKQIGISMKIQLMEWSAFIKVLNEKKDPKTFDAAMLGWSLGIDPDCYTIWHSSEYPQGFNFIGYKNPLVDSLLIQGREEISQEKRKKIYENLYSEISKDSPYVFLFFSENLHGINKRVNGLSKPGPAGLMTKIENIYLQN